MEYESKPAQIVDLICEGNAGVIEVKCHVVERGKRFVVQPVGHSVLSGRPPMVSTAALFAAYKLHMDSDSH